MRPRPQRLLDYREYPVLYVDDEPENLRIFKLAFRREFSTLTATSGEEGIEIVNERPVAIVLADHRMPGMLGTEFLARVRELDPKTLRVLVTAYGDADTLRSAINDGSIYRYVPKPWNPDELRLAIRQGIDLYALDREREELLKELTALNRVSQIINRELDLQPLLDLLLDTVAGELGFDGATLLFFDATGRTLSRARTHPRAGDSVGSLQDLAIRKDAAPRFIERLHAGEVQLLTIERALELEAPVSRWVMDVAADDLLVVPLISKQGVIGALAVDNRRGGERFNVSHQTLLEGLAVQAASAIENARLVEDLRRSRRQVMRADRLGTLGTLAAGLAHEINNPLVSIQTFLTLAPSKRTEEDTEFWGDYHDLACREVERIRGLVATMQSLGRGSSDAACPAAFEVGELLQEVAMLVGREARAAGIRLEVDCQPDAPKLVAVRDQLHQVLLNLALNAIDATPANGRVVLEAHADDRQNPPGLILEVRDTGRGIPEEDLERIFDPFYTSKDPDKGTGLGLMICHGIVAAHGGQVEVESREGEGSIFRLRLPLEPPQD